MFKSSGDKPRYLVGMICPLDCIVSAKSNWGKIPIAPYVPSGLILSNTI